MGVPQAASPTELHFGDPRLFRELLGQQDENVKLVEQKLGLRTDNTPTDWNGVQPRAQIVWDARADGRDVVRLGAGAFTAQPHYYLQANNIFFDGLQLADLTQKRRKDAAFVGNALTLARAILLAVERVTGELGLLQTPPAEYRARTRERRLRIRGLTPEVIQAKVAERTAARAAKDFARGDALRAELAALGVSLHDGAEGTDWTIEQ